MKCTYVAVVDRLSNSYLILGHDDALCIRVAIYIVRVHDYAREDT